MNNIKKVFKFGAIFLCWFIGYLFCNNFLNGFGKKRSSSIGQIKNEIAETFITILNQSSKTIEFLAKSQIETYKAISELINNDKESKLIKANKQDLENTLIKLKALKEDNDKYIAKIIEFLKLANANFIEKTESKERC